MLHIYFDLYAYTLLLIANILFMLHNFIILFTLENRIYCIFYRSIEVPGFAFFHDFVVTKSHYIFTQAPLDFEPLPFVLGMQVSIFGCENALNFTEFVT